MGTVGIYQVILNISIVQLWDETFKHIGSSTHCPRPNSSRLVVLLVSSQASAFIDFQINPPVHRYVLREYLPNQVYIIEVYKCAACQMVYFWVLCKNNGFYCNE